MEMVQRHKLRGLRVLALLGALALVGLLAVVLAMPASAQKEKEGGAAGSQSGATYVGADTCKTCHEDMFKNWEASPHWKTTLDTHAEKSKQGCEACPGPGSAHVEGGGDKTKIFTFKGASAEEISNRCLTCHTYSHEPSLHPAGSAQLG
jgi:hypothetical protein